MNLHHDTTLFKDAILATAQLLGIREIYIEKDYWITLALHTIFHSDMADKVVFKGGTSLSKCYHLIDRFSEDIDTVILYNRGETDNQLKKKVRGVSKIVESILPEIEVKGLTNKFGNIRKTAHQYDRIYNGYFGQVREYIVVETTSLGSSEPFEKREISCFMADMMQEKGQNDLIEIHKMHPFSVQVLNPNRTFCEKIMSLVRFSSTHDPYTDLRNKIRHIYDLYQMLKDENIQTFFESEHFDEMMILVGKDDITSFKKNNEWLREHPSKALIFDDPLNTWNKIKAVYSTTFRELVLGAMPDEGYLIETLEFIAVRLKNICWDLKR